MPTECTVTWWLKAGTVELIDEDTDSQRCGKHISAVTC
jgi:hypothetical protein